MFETGLLDGQHILVTGGGTGLGKAMAARFAGLGAEVTLWGRRSGKLEAAAAEIGARAQWRTVDIRDAAAVDQAVAEIFARRPLTGLVNNAAGNFLSRTEDLSANGFNAVAATVFHGSFQTTLSCAKRWLESGSRASVLSILTTWVWTGSPFVVPSAMSKAGIAAMTQSLAVEWGPRGLRFNAIAPGPFPTKGAWDRLLPGEAGASMDVTKVNPMRRTGEHSELANLAAFLMADGAAYINGAIVPIDGGQWLNNAGSFGGLSALADEDWQAMRAAITAANAKDKAERG